MEQRSASARDLEKVDRALVLLGWSIVLLLVTGISVGPTNARIVQDLVGSVAVGAFLLTAAVRTAQSAISSGARRHFLLFTAAMGLFVAADFYVLAMAGPEYPRVLTGADRYVVPVLGLGAVVGGLAAVCGGMRVTTEQLGAWKPRAAWVGTIVFGRRVLLAALLVAALVFLTSGNDAVIVLGLLGISVAWTILLIKAVRAGVATRTWIKQTQAATAHEVVAPV